VRTDFDPGNCGTCGNTCADGSICQNGGCVAFSSTVLVGLDAPDGGALRRDLGDVFVDGSRVLYTSVASDSVYSVPLSGGTPSTLAVSQNGPIRVVGDGTFAYWSSYAGGAVVRAHEDGTGSFEVVAPANAPWALAVDSSYVYWIDSGTGKLMQAPKAPVDAGGGLTLASTACQSPTGLGAAPTCELVWDGPTTLYLFGLRYSSVQENFAFTTPSGPYVDLGMPTCCAPFAASGRSFFCIESSSTNLDWYDTSSPTAAVALSGLAAYPLAQAVMDEAGCGAFSSNVQVPLSIATHPPSPALSPAIGQLPVALGAWAQNVWLQRMARSGTTLVFSYEWASSASTPPPSGVPRNGIAAIAVPQ
jgi:hypothetical protein